MDDVLIAESRQKFRKVRALREENRALVVESTWNVFTKIRNIHGKCVFPVPVLKQFAKRPYGGGNTLCVNKVERSADFGNCL
jgi:hypothetical protein